MKKIVLLTSNFPYGNGETFLKVEIPYLSKHFEEIYILPTHIADSNQIYILPKNIQILKTSFALSVFDKLLAIRFLGSKTVLTELFKKRKQGFSWTIQRFKTMLNSFARAKQILRELEKFENKESFVFYSYWSDDSAIAIALLKKKYPKVKCIARAHGWDVYESVSPIGYLPFRTLLKEHLSQIFPVSKKGEIEIKTNWGGKSSNNVFHKYLGVNSNNKLNTKTNHSSLSLVSCSNLIPLKRVHLIIEALAMIDEKIEIKWNHFGYGPLFSHLKEKCRLEFKENITFTFHGAVENNFLLDWYDNNYVDLFINVSETEGIPVSIMEALSKGIPVMATRVGGNPEIVNTDNGLVLPENLTAEFLMKEIVAFSQMDNQTIKLKRQEAFNTWEKSFNAKINFTDFVRVLEKL